MTSISLNANVLFLMSYPAIVIISIGGPGIDFIRFINIAEGNTEKGILSIIFLFLKSYQ